MTTYKIRVHYVAGTTDITVTAKSECEAQAIAMKTVENNQCLWEPVESYILVPTIAKNFSFV